MEEKGKGKDDDEVEGNTKRRITCYGL